MGRINRRKFLKDTITASAGIGAAAGFSSLRTAGAETSTGNKTGLPTGKIGKHSVSRLIIGANQFTGYPHAAPLIYAKELFKVYFTKEKIVETLALCMENGIGTHITLTDPFVIDYLQLLEKTTGKRMQWIAQSHWFPPQPGKARKQAVEYIKLAADNGAIACFLQGAACDGLVNENNLIDLDYYIATIKKSGLLAGICGHYNKTIDIPIKAGIKPDFIMKTINQIQYNAPDPDVTSEMMAGIGLPWIAFKVLGAGRVPPETGFRFALQAGADFLNVGMFDFQVADNAKLFKETLSKVAQA